MHIDFIHRMHGRAGVRAAASALAFVFLLAYLPDLGHGFVKDDFGWVRRVAERAWPDLLLRSDIGFYRPLVMATFAVDHALYGLNAFGYGMTNLLICLASAALLARLARGLSMPGAAAVAAAAVWALNFHGINMGLLWLSGRTSLLCVFFALATALAMLRKRTVLAGVLCLLALLAKEEAAPLPLLWTMFLALDVPEGEGGGWRERARRAVRAWPLWAALAVYLALRARSGAFGAFDAPDEYRLFSSLPLLARNIAEYADRAGTVFVFVALVLRLAAGGGAFSAAERRTLRLAALWIPLTFVTTVSLPVRSNLYVLLPSCGSALALAAIVSRSARVAPERFRRAAAALVVLALLLVPVYRMRNERWVNDAALASRVVEIARQAAVRYPSGGELVLVDDPAVRPNFDSAFLVQIPEALRLHAGPGWTGRIVAAGEPVPVDAVVVRLVGGAPVVSWP